MATILALIVAVISAVNGYWVSVASPYVLVASLLLLALAYIGRLIAYKGVLRIQNKVMSAALTLFQKDRRQGSILYYFFAFALFSFMLPPQPWAFYFWIVAFGIGFDLLIYSIKRAYMYAEMPFLTSMLAKSLEKSVRDGDEKKAYEWLEVAIDSSAKATKKGQNWLASTALQSIQTLIETYVQEVARQDVRILTGNPNQRLSFLDKVNSLCIFVSERLLWLFGVSQEAKSAPIAESIISEYGKMSVFFAKHNPKVATIPLAFLKICSDRATEPASLTRIALTLSETTKLLMAYSKEKNESYRDLIITSLATLEQVVKMLFRNNREGNVVFLMQPFAEIAEFIGQDDMRAFPDREEYLREIKRVLNEFQALQVVSKNVEGVAEDSTASYQQDMPYMP